ncbi:putative colanic acid biosynthesis acetyltransferase [Flavihumibacter stibioxidans]|uniref:Colanic acid biosynthesis acetyltransferase WcaF n=1 Tax=Flavihumibacter stibioxidans TaxID=1834163 RepID=A0ABR7M7L1_9BACT|nr:putative colanic acid biosynthesis acetyltransferase [Flavihumibacter stibioxidans]MBC6491014.1 colanic acid biosynthesis acetyltransferase WcaF [Flavihumibacter stibioxidans]
MSKTNLSAYNNQWFDPGAGKLKRLCWYVVNAVVFRSYLVPVSSVKRALLKAFGARIGQSVVIKPQVNIKYPWLLSIGDHSWIGENVWIDNLVQVTIGANCCLSQGAFLLTGNHDYTSPTFELMVRPIILEEGAWIGAQALVCPGVTCASHSVLTAKSVATKNLFPYMIYQGNPAVPVKERIIPGQP